MRYEVDLLQITTEHGKITFAQNIDRKKWPVYNFADFLVHIDSLIAHYYCGY